MDRVLKIINLLLLSIVGMLLLIGVMVIVQGSKVDLGKVADWWAGLTAIGTVATFVVALVAYNKWIDNKNRERAYEIVDDLITVRYIKISDLINQLHIKSVNLSYKLNGVNHCLKDEVLDDFTNSFIELNTELQALSKSVHFRFFVISKYGYYPLGQYLVCHVNLMRDIESFDSCIKMYYENIDYIYMREHESIRKKHIKSMKDSLSIVVDQCNKITGHVSFILSYKQSIFDYLTKEKPNEETHPIKITIW
ncbi:TPA: hypothetical protein R5X33_001946 [Enterobacter cloacae]|nr:hypothetical protein [Enterobacter cloacae]